MSGQRIDRSWTALVIFLLGVCLFAGLGSIGLVGPDEPRYASIARAMAQTGDWLTPRLWGQPWFEKPVLYYWSAGAAFRMFGASDWAARLPSALAALAAALLLAWAANRVFGSGTAILTLAIFPTTLGLLAFAHAATMDMLLASSLAAAMVAALLAIDWHRGADRSRPRSAIPLAATGACIGLGTLDKGPIAIILAGGSVVLWAICSKRWRDALRFLRWEPLAAFAVVTLPWYIACSLANSTFARYFLWHQNVQRFLTPVFEHAQPWWFFVPVLLLGLLPWTAALILAARDGWRLFRHGRAAHSPSVFVACWAAFPLIFFSFSESKLPGYILPALPPLALLIARSIDRVITGKTENRAESPGRLGSWVLGLVGLTWVVLSVTAGHWLHRLPRTWDIAHRNAIIVVLAIAAAIGVVVILLALAGRVRLAVAASALSMGILTGAIAWIFLPRVGLYLSARDAAISIRDVAGQNAIATYKLPRDWVYGLGYYRNQELPEWSPSEAQNAWVLTTQKALAAIPRDEFSMRSALKLPTGLVLIRVSASASHGQAASPKQ